MFEETHYDRRRFLGITAMTMAAAHLGTMGCGERTIPHDTSRQMCPR